MKTASSLGLLGAILWFIGTLIDVGDIILGVGDGIGYQALWYYFRLICLLIAQIGLVLFLFNFKKRLERWTN